MRKLSAFPAMVALLLCAARPLLAQHNVPAGTSITVTLDQSVSSKDAKVGQTVPATVAQAVVVSGATVIPKGSPATAIVATAVASGRLSTPAQLYLKLTSIQINGRTYTVSTGTTGEKGSSHAKRDAVAIGGGTAAGAIIGALAGGGKGAAIGAAAGAGVGTAGAAATGKKDITFSAETKLSFRLKSAVKIQ